MVIRSSGLPEMLHSGPNFNKSPLIHLNGLEKECFQGWKDICHELNEAVYGITGQKKVIVLEPYQGINYEDI